MEPMQPEILAEPVIATMCISHIVQDETPRVTYMDVVTTSMGRVALSSSPVATASRWDGYNGLPMAILYAITSQCH